MFRRANSIFRLSQQIVKGQNFQKFSSCQLLLRFNDDFGLKNLDKPDWDKLLLSNIKRNVIEKCQVEAKNEGEVEKFRTENRISIVRSKGPVPDPIFTIEECNFPKEMISKLARNGISKPMPIQAQGWPIALSGYDMIGIGETGSGKTLGFLLPAFRHILNQDEDSNHRGPRVVIMAPTRELAQQTEKVAQSYGGPLGLRTVSVYGGASRGFQLGKLQRGTDIVVGTPGRMLDFLESGDLSLNNCTFAVLDEADQMLDMGFEPQMRGILSQIRPDRQMLMWSATWPSEVQQLASDFFDVKNNFVHLNIGSIDLQANPNIEQVVEVCQSSHEKKDKLVEMIEETEGKILVFAATKKTVDFLEHILSRRNIRSIGIHGDKSQNARDRTLDMFRSGRRNVLIATDVAARGLDVDDVKMVINYDFPSNIESYVHRIGRTGRRGKTGKAFSMIVSTEAPRKLIKDLIEVLQEAKQEIPKELKIELSNASPTGKNSMRFGKKYANSSFNNRRFDESRQFRRPRRQSGEYDSYYNQAFESRNRRDDW